MAKCPTCGATTYKQDFGCWTCGLGNPYKDFGMDLSQELKPATLESEFHLANPNKPKPVLAVDNM